jgi:hypothetical protein
VDAEEVEVADWLETELVAELERLEAELEREEEAPVEYRFDRGVMTGAALDGRAVSCMDSSPSRTKPVRSRTKAGLSRVVYRQICRRHEKALLLAEFGAESKRGLAHRGADTLGLQGESPKRPWLNYFHRFFQRILRIWRTALKRPCEAAVRLSTWT